MGDPGKLARLELETARRDAIARIGQASSKREAMEAVAAFGAAAQKYMGALAGRDDPATFAGVRAVLASTARGREIVASFPPGTKIEWKEFPTDGTAANYDSKTDTLYIPAGLTNAMAAVVAAHEMLHADQIVNHGRGKDRNPDLKVADLLRMEVQAIDAQLDVWEQLGRPPLPGLLGAQTARQAQLRVQDRQAYEMEIRTTYRKRYAHHH